MDKDVVYKKLKKTLDIPLVELHIITEEKYEAMRNTK
jgi:hypothetical protein